MNALLILMLFALDLTPALAQQPLALVYNGPGVCPVEDDCVGAAASIARQAGMRVRYVGPNETNFAIFNSATVWIQPGGVAATAAEAMSFPLKQALKRFVFAGGGYVGLCAGGFLATEMVGTTSVPGLGIFPGQSILLEGVPGPDGVALYMRWNGARKYVYFEGGPYFSFARGSAEATAYYSDGSVGSARAYYGSGRVYVTGAHPEAPADWFQNPYVPDSDGLDTDLAVDMVRWTAGGN